MMPHDRRIAWPYLIGSLGNSDLREYHAQD